MQLVYPDCANSDASAVHWSNQVKLLFRISHRSTSVLSRTCRILSYILIYVVGFIHLRHILIFLIAVTSTPTTKRSPDISLSMFKCISEYIQVYPELSPLGIDKTALRRHRTFPSKHALYTRRKQKRRDRAKPKFG